MESNTNEAKMNALIEGGRKALEKYLVSLGEKVCCLNPINCPLSELSANEAKIKVLIESGQRVAKNYYQERISNLSIRS
ncbi:MAG: hypothetical protein FD167_4877 [bacterium]|nr:MAG: hypothetical protein FD167_4877 [bacterium]